MTPDVLLVSVGGDRREAVPWIEAFGRRLPGLAVAALGDAVDPAAVRYVAAWKHPHGSLAGLPALDAVFSLGAGVDHLLADAALPAGVPVARVVDPDLTNRMSEWVLLQVLAHHRQARRYARQQAEARWADDPHQPAARAVRVGVMGLGVLGIDAATKLAMVGFDVAGWSRSPRDVPGLACYAGTGALDAFLARTDILVVLLPLTPDTEGLLDARLFGKLARGGRLGGPVLVNAGRGGLQREDDILACLDDGTLRAATLDVFTREPLERASPLWRHPGVTVTPHNAALSDPEAIADLIAGQILAHRRGEPLRHLVDRDRAY
ncbi:2-hydroxyacid dehydrogenase [Lichenibacterium ramalinae]|uniref:Glyoxylate/hydroxypyruvate reductase A n=1 Tax=Lichenibacterium ramalinae TaxID=2316527 RepID=A0A4Q2R7Y9_9HYPH|nr:glyoxylate/hydroxypyruvate reductase A [Lichenibacterium ramalinae]RYB01853.1 glyoxylate/hydroxypyruvate reductase A [Lichenibacterium ramalinae]